MESSRIRDQTLVNIYHLGRQIIYHLGRQILYHWDTRDAHFLFILVFAWIGIHEKTEKRCWSDYFPLIAAGAWVCKILAPGDFDPDPAWISSLSRSTHPYLSGGGAERRQSQLDGLAGAAQVAQVQEQLFHCPLMQEVCGQKSLPAYFTGFLGMSRHYFAANAKQIS